MDNTIAADEKRKPYSPNRSCERCRTLKIRCVPEDPTKCQRCARLHVDCVYALPAKRKPRKRTDAKVAELEKQVRALSSIIKKQHNAPNLSSSASDHAGEHTDWSPMETSEKTSSSPEGILLGVNAPQVTKAPHNNSSADFDAVEAGIITRELAYKLFYIFRDRFAPVFPLVAFPPDTTPEQVQTSRPFLFQAIIAATCSHVDPSLGPTLNKRIMFAIAEYGMVKGVKSLDLLQAILVTTCWHYPETSFEHLKYHQYAHLAAGMASYVGIERKSIAKAGKAVPQQSDSFYISDNTILSDEERNYDLLNRQRTMVACYLLCSGICRSLHRPTILPFTNWMAQCLDNLQNSPFAAPTDHILASWVRLQKLMTESSTAFGLDDDDVFVDLAEPRVQRALAFYDLEMKSWRESLSIPSSSVPLEYIYHASRVGLYEIVMYLDHEQEDLHPPFSLEKIGRPADRKKEPTIAHIEAFVTCWNAASDAIEGFLAQPVELLQCSPFYFFVRLIYCVTVLIKLSESASISSFSNPPDIGNREAIVLLISRLIRHMKAVEVGNVCPVASRVVTGLKRMLHWLNRPKEISTEKQKLTDDLLEPLMYLALQRPSEEQERSEDVCFVDAGPIGDNILPRQEPIPQDIAFTAVPESALAEIDNQSFINWEDFDWNFVSPSGFEFPSDLALFDVDNLAFGTTDNTLDPERII